MFTLTAIQARDNRSGGRLFHEEAIVIVCICMRMKTENPAPTIYLISDPSAALVACPMPHVGILTGIDHSLLAKYHHRLMAVMAANAARTHLTMSGQEIVMQFCQRTLL